MSESSSRPAIIAGNWKMYKTIEEALGYVKTLSSLVKRSQASVYLAVPFTAIHPTVQSVKELKAKFTIGAQNMHDASEGAFTGEIAAKMLMEAGAQFVILGHSERRHLFHESNDFINKKVRQATASNIQAIVCVGETLAERERGETEAVVKEQILKTLDGTTADDLAKLILAYEPVWAIGTGKVATPEEAQLVHAFCRSVIAENWGVEAAAQLVIQYGGSVKPENASALLKQDDIDGLLVGGASLSPEEFSQIIKSYKGAKKT